MQVGGIQNHGVLSQTLLKQQVSAAVLAKTQQANKAQGEAAATAVKGAAEERNETPDKDNGSSRLNVVA